MTISAIGNSCGCTDVGVSRRTIPPGSFTDLEVTVRINDGENIQARITNFRAEVLVHVAEAEGVAERVVMQGVYLPPVIYEYETQRQMVGPDRTFNYAIDLKFDQQRGARVVGVQLDDRQQATVDFQVDDATTERYQTAQVLVAGSIPREVQLPTTGQLTLWTNLAEMPEITVPIIFREEDASAIKASPVSVAFGVHPTGERPSRVAVVSWPATKTLSLQSVTSTLPEELSIKTEALPQRGQRAYLLLRCELDTRALSGAVDGTIQVDLAERDANTPPASIAIPFTAFIKDPTSA